MKNRYTLEICTYSVEGAIAAQEGKANRIELCDNLPEGGTTPSAATIEIARKSVIIDLNVIIRPRGGDFCYSEIEYQTMYRDIEIAKSLGANGVVFGILQTDGSIDVKRTEKLVMQANPMSVTFHRAFDMTSDPLVAMEEIIRCGADRILTSGQCRTVIEGLNLIRKLVEVAADRIIIMPGSGINDKNIYDIALQSGASEFHMSAKKKIDGMMEYRKTGISMGGEDENAEYQRWITDSVQVKKVTEILSGIDS